MNKENIRKVRAKDITVTGLLIAIGILLPTVFHAFNLGGAVFLPMHIPVLICGLLLGGKYGLITGLIVPFLSSALTGMPPMFPVAFTMCIELGTYGLVGGLLRKRANIYVSLVGAQIVGRIMGAIGNFIILGLAGKQFVFGAYITSVFVTALPGIILQIILVPAAIILIEKAGYRR